MTDEEALTEARKRWGWSAEIYRPGWYDPLETDDGLFKVGAEWPSTGRLWFGQGKSWEEAFEDTKNASP